MKNLFLTIVLLFLVSVSAIASSTQNFKNKDVENFASDAITSLNQYNYEIIENTQKGQSYFTNQGWENYKNALSRSHIYETVKANKLTSTIKNIGKAKFQAELIDSSGKHMWQITVPIQIDYQSEKGEFNTFDGQVILYIELVNQQLKIKNYEALPLFDLSPLDEQ